MCCYTTLGNINVQKISKQFSKKFLMVILALFSSVIKRYIERPYQKSHSMTGCICCDTEEKMLRQNAFAYDKYLVLRVAVTDSQLVKILVLSD